MNDARHLLREFWRFGVRVSLSADRFALEPKGVAPDGLRAALSEYAPEVKTHLADLPAPDRCEVCGEVTTGPAGNTGRLRCTDCALLVIERQSSHHQEARHGM